MRTLLRRVRGAAVNALFWGAIWFWIGVGIDIMFRLPWGGLVHDGSLYLFPTLMAGLGSGAFGAAIGGGFSLFIAANFRHQRVESLSPRRFALGGALVTAAAVLLTQYVTGAESLIDQALVAPMSLYGSLGLLMLSAGCVGGLTAFGTLKLAQRGAELERLEASEGPIPLEAGGTAGSG